MTKRKKPQTPEEVQIDIANHPERGKLDGDEVVAFDKVEFRGSVPREMYRLALEVGGATGDDKSIILTKALEEYVLRRLPLLERSESVKAEKFGVGRLQIRSKTFGAYKAKGRAKKANLDSSRED